MQNIGKIAREKRQQSGLTQQEVADLMGWGDWRKVSKIENGHQMLYADEYFELMEVLSAERIAKIHVNFSGKAPVTV